MTTELTHFIGGKHVKGTSGRFSDVFNPATGEVQAKCPLASGAEVRAAVAIANKVTAKSHEFMVAFVKDASKGVVAVGPDEPASDSCACD